MRDHEIVDVSYALLAWEGGDIGIDMPARRNVMVWGYEDHDNGSVRQVMNETMVSEGVGE